MDSPLLWPEEKDKICSPANQPGQEVQQPDLSYHDQTFPIKTQKPWQDDQECQPTGHSRYGGAGGAEEENKRARANHEVLSLGMILIYIFTYIICKQQLLCHLHIQKMCKR